MQEETAGTNDADGLPVDGSKFDETMYEGKWVTLGYHSAEGTACEIYIPEDWPVEESEDSPDVFVLPEEFSEFQFGVTILPFTVEAAGSTEALEMVAMSFGYTDGLNKINIDGIGDVYCGSTYEEVQVVDDVGSSFPAYSDSLFISGQEGLFAIMGRYEGSEKSPAEGVVEKFMQINRNVLSSLRPAETE